MARKRKSERLPFDNGSRQSEIEKLGRWIGITNQAIRVREKWKTDYRLSDLIDKYNGPLGSTDLDPEKRINRFWPAIQSKLPSLFFDAPTFKVRPMQRDNSERNQLESKIGQGILDSIARQDGNLRRSARLAIEQSLFSIGVLKVIYDPRLRPNPQAGKPIALRDQEGNAVSDPQTGLPIPVTNDAGEVVKEPRQVVTDEVYRWDWVNAHAMILPDQGPDPTKWTWIGEEVTIPIEMAKSDPRFTRAARDMFVPNVSRVDGQEAVVQELMKGDGFEDFGDFKYTEVWDIHNRRLYAWCSGVPGLESKFLIDKPYPDGIEDHPYSILSFSPILTEKPPPWPVPHTYTWLDIDEEYNSRRRQMFDGLQRTTRKVLYDDNTFPDEQSAIDMLSSNVDMEAVRLNTIDKQPIIHADTPISASFAQDLALIDAEFNRTSGTVGARTGRRSGSATEANIENQAGNIRDTDQRGEVSSWLSDAGHKMFQLVKATLTLDTWIKIKGFSNQEFQEFVTQYFGESILKELGQSEGLRQAFENRLGNEQWQQVTREDLEFEAEITILPGSVRPKTTEAERQDILEFMAILGANPQLAQSRELMRLVGNTFEFVNDALIDELFALSQRLIEQQANQAGRNQGGNNPQSQSQGGIAAALLNGV